MKKKAGFDIHDIAPLDTAPHAFCPALFGHARDDTFVGCHHTEALHAAYGGDKELHVFADCDHNSPRPRTWYFAACSFLLRALRLSSAENAAGHAVAGLDRDTGALASSPCDCGNGRVERDLVARSKRLTAATIAGRRPLVTAVSL